MSTPLDFSVYYSAAESGGGVEAYCPEFDLAGRGRGASQALGRLLDQVQTRLAEAQQEGTLWELLMQAGYHLEWDGQWHAPRRVVVDQERVRTEVA